MDRSARDSKTIRRTGARGPTSRIPRKPVTPAADVLDDQKTVRDELSPSPATTPTRPLAEIRAQLTRTWTSVTVSMNDPNATVRTDRLPLGPVGAVIASRPRTLAEAGTPSALRDEADFVVGNQLGAGGMGEVREAKQVALGRMIALKLLHGTYAQRIDVQERFLIEAKVTAELEHPGIVPVYDLGIDRDRRAFYAMKLVRGTTWNEVIDRRALPENIDILLKACDAVAFAHSKGIIHRDLKPENIMLGEFGEVQVLDWGLAAAIVPGGPAPSLADAGLIAGTPAYMAPEMALGEADRIGVASDIYLLGGILYRILLGVPPHGGTDTRMVVMAAACNALQRPAVGGELMSIAVRALASEPAARFATVRDFQASIRSYLEHHASIDLCRRAGEDLERAQADGAYGDFTQAIHGFREALRLWDGNAIARVHLDSAILGYAEAALAHGDLDLAESMLADGPPEHERLRARIASARRQRDTRLKRVQRLRQIAVWSGVGLAASLIIGASATAWQERRARGAEAEADQQRVRALEAELATSRLTADVAEKNRRRAQAFAPYATAMDRLMRGEGFYAEAEERFRQSLEADPTFSEAFFGLGEALRLKGDMAGAETAYLKADALDREATNKANLRALLLAGLADVDAFEQAKGIQIFKQIEALGSDDPLAKVGKALFLASRGHHEEARIMAQKAIDAAPGLWETHCAFGAVLSGAINDGCVDPELNLPTAIAALRKASALSPQVGGLGTTLLLQLLSHSTRPDDHDLLVAMSRGALTGNSQTKRASSAAMLSQVIALLDLINLGEDHVAEADALFAKIDPSASSPTLLAYARASLAARHHDLEGCFKILSELVRTQEDFTLLVNRWVQLGVSLPGKLKEVSEFYDGWKQRHPDQPSLALMDAQILLAQGKQAEAEAALIKAEKAMPFRREVSYLRVDLLLSQQKLDAALKSIESYVGRFPRDIQMRMKELAVLAKMRNLDKALTRLADLERDFPDQQKAIDGFKAKLLGGR